MRKQLVSIVAAGIIAVLISAPQAYANGQNSGGPPKSKPITITILHENDMHSYIEPLNTDLILGGTKTRVQLGGVFNAANIIKERLAESVNPIVLNAGDTIVGTIYHTIFKGDADAMALNLTSWDAIILGNHEFDDKDEGLDKLIMATNSPFVSSNVTAAEGSILADEWVPYKIIERDGERIGLFGIDIVGKTKGSSNPGKDITFTDEFETAQKYATLLKQKGINKIIAITHIGYNNDIKLAKMSKYIDVIVGGDSHTLLGDKAKLTKLGLEPEGAYPTMETSQDGKPVAIVQAWAYNRAVGTLRVDFDENGIITKAEGYPILPIVDSFKRKNSDGKRVELEGDVRNAALNDVKSAESLEIASMTDAQKKILAPYKDQLTNRLNKVIGEAQEEIIGGSIVRVPSKEHPDGSFAAVVTADAFLYALQQMGEGKVDAVIQNAGGVRTSILAGDITYKTAYEILPFNNTLGVFQITGAEIKSTLEEAINYALDPETSTGSFPYAAGLRYTAALNNKKGSRVSTIEIKNRNTQKWEAVNPDKTYAIGANSYIAGGKDGYITFGKVKDSGRYVDTFLIYTDLFIEYAKEKSVLEKPQSTNVTVTDLQ